MVKKQESTFAIRKALESPVFLTPEFSGKSLLDYPSPSLLSEENRGKLFVLLADLFENPNILLLQEKQDDESLSEMREKINDEIIELMSISLEDDEKRKKQFLGKIQKMVNRAFYDRSGERLLNESVVEVRQEKLLQDFLSAIDKTFANLNEMNSLIQLPVALKTTVIDERLKKADFFSFSELKSKFLEMKNAIQEGESNIKEKIVYLNVFLSELYDMFATLYKEKNLLEIDNATFFLQELLINIEMGNQKIEELPNEVGDLVGIISKISGVQIKDTKATITKENQEKEYSFSISRMKGSQSILRTRGKSPFRGALKMRGKPKEDTRSILADGVGLRFIGGEIDATQKKAEFFLKELQNQEGIIVTGFESQYIYDYERYKKVRSEFNLPEQHTEKEFDDDSKDFSNIVIRFTKPSTDNPNRKISCEMQFIPQASYKENEKGVMNHNIYKRLALVKALSLRSHTHGIPKDVVLRLIVSAIFLAEKDRGDKSMSFAGTTGTAKLARKRLREGILKRFFENLKVSKDGNLFFSKTPINVSQSYQNAISPNKREIIDLIWDGIMKGDEWENIPKKEKLTKARKKEMKKKVVSRKKK